MSAAAKIESVKAIMSGVIGISSDVSLFINEMLFALVVGTLLCSLAAIFSAVKLRLRLSAMFALISAISLITFLTNSLLASPYSWQAMYASYKVAPPPEKARRANDITRYWMISREQILLADWYLLSRRWGVCHELWSQLDCVHAPAEREPMGIVRELLTGVARGG
jgi:hypothetical protein